MRLRQRLLDWIEPFPRLLPLSVVSWLVMKFGFTGGLTCLMKKVALTPFLANKSKSAAVYSYGPSSKVLVGQHFVPSRHRGSGRCSQSDAPRSTRINISSIRHISQSRSATRRFRGTSSASASTGADSITGLAKTGIAVGRGVTAP